MKTIFAFLLAVCLLSACASSRPIVTEFSASKPARIEVDGNYIGATPIRYSWPSDYVGGDEFDRDVTIKAYSTGGSRPQIKRYERHRMIKPKVPTRVYFDMTAPPEKEE